MILKTQLNILQEKLKEIHESPYFYSDINEFAKNLRNLSLKIIDNHEKIEIPIIKVLIDFISCATNYLMGSTSKRIPYEIVYCLEDACARWIDEKTIITTALSPKLSGFAFQSINEAFYEFSKEQLDTEFKHKLVQVSFPEAYRRRPLCVTPLYHELGHFIDDHLKISDFAKFNFIHSLKFPGGLDESNGDYSMVWENHCAEYFADLYSAQFIGFAGVDFLNQIAGDNPVCATHPSTADRVKVVDDFLNGNYNPIVDMFNAIVNILHSNGKTLQKGLRIINLGVDMDASFDRVRPYRIKNKDELHAFIANSWRYLCGITKTPTGVWSDFSDSEVEVKVNDLVEKSIRNFMVLDQWSQNAPA